MTLLDAGPQRRHFARLVLVALAVTFGRSGAAGEPPFATETPVLRAGASEAELAPFESHVGRSPWEVPQAAATERLGLADRITALTRGRVQMEGGYAYVYDESAGLRASRHSVPDLLLRVGLSDRLEMRLGWPGYVATRYDGDLAPDSTGETLDPNVGFMFDLCPQRGWIPQTAVSASVPITWKGDPFALRSLQPVGELLYCWYLGDRLALGGGTGFALFREQGDHFSQLQQSINVDYLLNDRLDAFAAWEVLIDHGSADDGSQHLLSGGISWLVTERTSVTWRIGAGMNPRAPDFLTALRFAMRF